MTDNVEQKVGNRIYNFTDTVLPSEVQKILELDFNYGLPTTNINQPVVTIIKDLEGCIDKVKDDELSNEGLTEVKNNLRARGVNIVTNHIKYQRRSNSNHKKNFNLVKNIKVTRNFFKQHEDLLVMRSDKGNSTVVMYKEEYLTEMNKLVGDRKTYEKIKRDPTSKLQNISNRLIKKLVDIGILDNIQGKLMRTYSALAPRIYGLRKTHKPGCKLRPVVSSIGSPGYEIANFVHKSLLPFVMSLKYNVTDSFHFVDQIKLKKANEDHVLISLDVVSLFTNVHNSLIRKIIIERWDEIQKFVQLDQTTLLELIDFCYDSGYFVFDGNFYLQKEGCAMGSPASPSIAIIAVDYVVSMALTHLDFEIPIIKSYVDDLFAVVPKDKVDIILDVFNSVDKDIQFTLEVENNGKLPFLDILIERSEDGDLITSWFKKPYSSGRILNFNSNHPLSQKLGVAKGFLNRAMRLSHVNKTKESIRMVRKLLSSNNYPNKVISKCEKIVSERIKNNIRSNNVNKNWSFSRFPYIKGLSPRLGSLFRHTNCKLVFYNVFKVKDLFSRPKDKVKKEDRSGLVYRIPCSCGKWYVGQTRQKLKARVRQHKLDCRPKKFTKNNKTALAEHHFVEDGHNFQFDDVEILDLEKNYIKRNLSEMIFIKAMNCVNFRSDTQNLSTIYSDLINEVKDLVKS
ncbi:uncharacterized protein LOC124187022 [Neodiprion fabricii]|uniref:uncharacterized protein LOC124187022 n=1 Tax=Neodiprion fabricii TaxID=2872261 RepID=UPI001ED8C679|nr:uncharacterized protein LOC124187022 [Neodiprion fabricii]